MPVIELRRNRVAKNNSILARSDGSFFDFNGSINYSGYHSLLRVHPELKAGRGKYTPPKTSSSTTHSNSEVTKKASKMKARFNLRVLNDYLPFYDLDRIISNIGLTYDNELAVFMWSPILGGSSPSTHYGIVQYRGDPRAKWMSVIGSDTKTVESIVTDNSPVYCTFGMGDFLLLKSTGLNYMCFTSDGAAKNSPYADYMKRKIGNRTIRLIADNDHSGRKTAGYLRSYGFKVEVFDWNKLGDLVKIKMDVRDLAKIIKFRGGTLLDLKELLTTGDLYVNR